MVDVSVTIADAPGRGNAERYVRYRRAVDKAKAKKVEQPVTPEVPKETVSTQAGYYVNPATGYGVSSISDLSKKGYVQTATAEEIKQGVVTTDIRTPNIIYGRETIKRLEFSQDKQNEETPVVSQYEKGWELPLTSRNPAQRFQELSTVGKTITVASALSKPYTQPVREYAGAVYRPIKKEVEATNIIVSSAIKRGTLKVTGKSPEEIIESIPKVGSTNERRVIDVVNEKISKPILKSVFVSEPATNIALAAGGAAIGKVQSIKESKLITKFLKKASTEELAEVVKSRSVLVNSKQVKLNEKAVQQVEKRLKFKLLERMNPEVGSKVTSTTQAVIDKEFTGGVTTFKRYNPVTEKVDTRVLYSAAETVGNEQKVIGALVNPKTKSSKLLTISSNIGEGGSNAVVNILRKARADEIAKPVNVGGIIIERINQFKPLKTTFAQSKSERVIVDAGNQVFVRTDTKVLARDVADKFKGTLSLEQIYGLPKTPTVSRKVLNAPITKAENIDIAIMNKELDQGISIGVGKSQDVRAPIDVTISKESTKRTTPWPKDVKEETTALTVNVFPNKPTTYVDKNLLDTLPSYVGGEGGSSSIGAFANGRTLPGATTSNVISEVTFSAKDLGFGKLRGPQVKLPVQESVIGDIEQSVIRKGTVNLGQSTFNGDSSISTIAEVKPSTISITKPSNILVTDSGLTSDIGSDILSKPVSSFDKVSRGNILERGRSKLFEDTKPVIESREDVGQKQYPRIRVAEKVAQSTKQLQVEKLMQKLKSPRFGFGFKPAVSFGINLKLPGSGANKSKQTRALFTAYTLKGGKEVAIASGQDILSVLKKGKKQVQGNISASLFVKNILGEEQNLQGFANGGFVASKRKGFKRLIEQSKYRLNLGGERMQIQAAKRRRTSLL